MAVLVAYARGCGSTRGVAERIGARLDAAGLRAEVRELGTSDALGDPDAVVLGSAVYASAGSRPRRRSPGGTGTGSPRARCGSSASARSATTGV